MEPQIYQAMHELQDNHWWFVGQRFLIDDLISRFVRGKDKPRILDAGCGTGAMLKLLQRYGWTVGLDCNKMALKFCKEDSHGILCQGFLSRLPFEDNAFDLITVFNVLYHQQVSDDAVAIGEVYRCLKRSGTALFKEPAFNFLRRKHDVAEHTRRRYTLQDFRTKIEKANFKIQRIFYANNFIFPIVLMVKLKEKFLEARDKADSDLTKLPSLLNKGLILLYRIETLMLRKVKPPWGVSVVCVAVKD